jgi:hypothetical protein
MENSGICSVCGKMNWGLPQSMTLAFNVTDDIQLPHTGPAQSWHAFTHFVQNRGKPRLLLLPWIRLTPILLNQIRHATIVKDCYSATLHRYLDWRPSVLNWGMPKATESGWNRSTRLMWAFLCWQLGRRKYSPIYKHSHKLYNQTDV